MKKHLKWIGILLLSLLMIACSQDSINENNGEKKNNQGQNNENVIENNNEEEKEDVTVSIATTFEGEWLEEMKPKVEEEFPYITLELVDELPFIDEEEFEDVVFQGMVPDIIPTREQRRDFVYAREYGLEYDFEDIVEKKSFDLSIYDEDIIESLRNATPTNGIVALPQQSNYFALHYNKEIFDQFGVEYPTEGLTWPEVMELAADMTRDGVYGLTYNPWLAWFIFTQFEENLIDPDTLEVDVINSTAMQEMFSVFQQYASIPNNRPEGELGGVFEDGNVAMEVNWARTYNIEGSVSGGIGIDFDFAPFPTWDANPGVSVEPNVASWMITSDAEDKEAAFDVISFLTSPENLTPLIRKGRIPALADPEIQGQFMADLEEAENFNLAALQELQLSSGPPKISRYENNAPIRELMEQYIIEDSEKDVNEFLREVQQVIENYVIEQESKE